MQHAPFLHVRKRSFWKLAIKLTRQDVHGRLKFTIDCMKVRRPVVTVVHGDYDTKKSTEFRHLANYSAEARRFRLTIRLSDARLRRRKTKLIYPDHRPTPWLTEDDTPAIARTDC